MISRKINYRGVASLSCINDYSAEVKLMLSVFMYSLQSHHQLWLSRDNLWFCLLLRNDELYPVTRREKILQGEKGVIWVISCIKSGLKIFSFRRPEMMSRAGMIKISPGFTSWLNLLLVLNYVFSLSINFDLSKQTVISKTRSIDHDFPRNDNLFWWKGERNTKMKENNTSRCWH